MGGTIYIGLGVFAFALEARHSKHEAIAGRNFSLVLVKYISRIIESLVD